MKRIALLLLILVGMLVSCDVRLSQSSPLDEAQISAAATDGETKSYLILGDSIAAHYGVSNEESYEYKLAQLLRADGDKWIGSNWGIPGNTSDDLVTLLARNALDPQKRVIIENADLITVSIGGNNLLRFLREHGFEEFPSDGKISWSKLARAFANGSEEMCVAMRSDLEVIMKQLRALNPTAIVLVQNVHNVARDFRGTISLFGKTISPTDLVEPFFRPLLNTIRDGAEELGYTVADTYSAFSESEETKLLRREMIHPNANGHTLIAEVLYDAYRAAIAPSSMRLDELAHS